MSYYPIALLALVGAWTLRGRRAELWTLLAPIALASLIAAVTVGSLRMRYLAELPLVLLAPLGARAARIRNRPPAGHQPAAARQYLGAVARDEPGGQPPPG